MAHIQEGSHTLPDCWRKVFQLKLAFGIVAIPGGRNMKGEKKSEVLVLRNPFNFLSTTMEFHGPLSKETGCICECQGHPILLDHHPTGRYRLELFEETQESLLKHPHLNSTTLGKGSPSPPIPQITIHSVISSDGFKLNFLLLLKRKQKPQTFQPRVMAHACNQHLGGWRQEDCIKFQWKPGVQKRALK